ncbi:Glucose-1-phosphate cytidylyltransferase [compost metagenome]
MSPDVLPLIEGGHISWEMEPLETLARKGDLMAFRHMGFWQPMDTLREKRMLESLWETNKAPWRVW